MSVFQFVLFFLLFATVSLSCITVPIPNWSNIIAYSHLKLTLQVVANPLLNPATSPVASTVFKELARLNVDLVRYVPWFPYPKVGVAELNPPQNGVTSWNFDDILPQFRAFMAATYGLGKRVVLNFSTQPAWIYSPNNYGYPDNPNKVDWDYVRGAAAGFPNTTQLVAAYYGRLLSWIINGQFTDEFGVVHKNPGETYQISHWEVFNEVESEHQFTVQEYTKQYDAIVREIRRVADPDQKIEFVGLALASRNIDWITYFLDPKNHDPLALPISHFSYHFYGSCSSRTDPDTYEQFFTAADSFIPVAQTIVNLRDKLSPNTKILVDELGVILPNDNSPTAPVPPRIYWNAAGAMYAYLFAKMAVMGYDLLGESQLAGVPVIPEWDIMDAQFPSVSMVNWTTGLGNARLWVLDLLSSQFAVDDIFVETENPDPSIFVQGIVSMRDTGTRVLFVNKKNLATCVNVQGSSGSVIYTVDVLTGDGPARKEVLSTDQIILNPFAVVVLDLRKNTN